MRNADFLTAWRALSGVEGWLDERGTMGDDDYHARLGSLVDEADRAEDAAQERALAKDAHGSHSTSPVIELRSDALKCVTVSVGAKMRVHGLSVYQVVAWIM